MQYIIFGVIAVVGLIFLIIYNLRADAKNKKAKLPEEPIEAPPSAESNVQERASEDAKLLVEDAREHGKLVEDATHIRRPAKDKTSDFEYREALRSFHTVNESLENEEEASKEEEQQPPVPPVQKADDQFREALRSMKK